MLGALVEKGFVLGMARGRMASLKGIGRWLTFRSNRWTAGRKRGRRERCGRGSTLLFLEAGRSVAKNGLAGRVGNEAAGLRELHGGKIQEAEGGLQGAGGRCSRCVSAVCAAVLRGPAFRSSAATKVRPRA